MLHTLAATTLALLMALGPSSVMAAAQRIAHTELQLHGGPGPKFGIVATVLPGMPITVMWCNSSAEWCLVDNGMDQGWAPLEDIRAKAGGGAGRTASGSTSSNVNSSDAKPADPSVAAAGNAAAPTGGATVSIQAPAATVTVKLP